jgi:hypothetical protein
MIVATVAAESAAICMITAASVAMSYAPQGVQRN